MIEIIVLIGLLKANARNAEQRGKSGGMAKFYTFALWIVLEITGFIIGGAMEMEGGAYVLALVFAILGGVASNVLSKSGDIIHGEIIEDDNVNEDVVS